MFDNYLLSYCKENLIEILKHPDDNKHFSVEIDFVELSGNEPNLGNLFLRDPEKSLEEWNKAVHKVQTNQIQQSDENYIFKKHTHCRIHSLPLYPELHRIKFPQNDDTNKFLQVSGTVVRITAVKMMEHKRQYICTTCKYVMLACAEYEMKNLITVPKKCANPDDCRGRNIVSVGELNPEFCKDYQEIKMQETGGRVDAGSMPNSMWVTLEDNLVDSCQPGDNIVVCGLVKRRHNPFHIGKKMEIELVVKANHLQVNNNNYSTLSITPGLKDMFKGFWQTYSDSPLPARDIILKSICPEIFGLYIVKLAMAVVLAGGSTVQKSSNTGVRVRTEPHLLLVGDPGTGKSELLRFASKVVPRSVLTTGVGSTAAGLTTAAVMENGEWQLEGGALVLSDGGICCIDEFNTIKEHDRTSIHEAMEQQTISVAKAGIVCKLNTRCSVLAATNPKGKLDPSLPLNMIIALASPLLSRFDLILLLRDTFDQEWDKQLVDFIFTSSKHSNSSKLSDSVLWNGKGYRSETINWSIETLQAYFAVIKKNHPMLTEDSNRILSHYYQAQRMNQRNKSRTTVRLLDSLVRLSQGHARLMYHEEVEIVDAVTAVILVETSMEAGSSVFSLSFNLRNDFPEDPTSNYRELVDIVLKRLNLNDLLEKELDRINKKPSDRPGPSGGNANSPTVRIESKFFHVADKKDDQQSPSNCKIIEENKATGEGPSGVKSSIKKSSLKETEKVIKNEEHRKKIIDMVIDVEDKDFDDGEKRNEDFNKPTKMAKRKKDTNPKKIKTKTKEKEINDDLAALRCMPSVNDIFRMDDCDVGDHDDGIALNFDEITIDQVMQNIQEQSLEIDADNKELTIKEVTNEALNEGQPVDDQPKVLSQRTNVKNKLSKFRFIAKDNQEIESADIQLSSSKLVNDAESNKFESSSANSDNDPTSSNHKEVTLTQSRNKPTTSKKTSSPSNESFVDNDFHVSFADVVTSTQTDTRPMQHKNPEQEAPPVTKSVMKKEFNIKKIVLGNAKPGSVASNVPPLSMFESPEDVDLDLDI